MEFIAQGQDATCFNVAVANCVIHLGGSVSPEQLQESVELGLAVHGSCIKRAEVVEFLGAPLVHTVDPEPVFEYGGILGIMHPVYNGHCVFIFPEGKRLKAVNSWLGPLVMGSEPAILREFIAPPNLGGHWRICDGKDETACKV